MSTNSDTPVAFRVIGEPMKLSRLNMFIREPREYEETEIKRN